MLGGALGALLRYVIGLLIMKKFPHPPIPIAMIIVNGTGSLGLGLFLGKYFHNYEPIVQYEIPIFLIIGVGFFGAFTTFSTFSVETIQLLREKKLTKALIYVLLSLVFSMISFIVGIVVTTM